MGFELSLLGTLTITGIDRCENCLAPFRQLDIPSAHAAEELTPL